MAVTSLPPRIPLKGAQKCALELRRLEAERHVAVTERAKLERGRPAAVEADRRAYGQALREGKSDDPGTPQADELDEKIASARRRENALGSAVGQARIEFEAIVHKNRDELKATAGEQLEAARKNFGEALTALVEAHRELAAAGGLGAWLDRFPEHGYSGVKFTPPLRGLTTRSGDAPSFAAVSEALRALAEPPQRAQPAGSMPRPQMDAA